MSKIAWDEPGNRSYELGVDRGVLYPEGGMGVPWNGLIAVNEAPSGAGISEGHYEGRKFRHNGRSGFFSATISAYTYPREFEKYDGLVDGHTAQNRGYFGFSYRTQLANDLTSNSGHLIHLVYNAIAAPTAHPYSSSGAAVAPINFSWAIETTPVILADGQIASHLIVNTQMAHDWAVTAFEDLIYGSDLTDPYLPSIAEVIQLFEDTSILKIIDHGDGTWTADGPDSAIRMLDATTFDITWPSAVYLDDVTYKISSL